MNPAIIPELMYFVWSFLLGMGLMLLYDGLLILRRLVQHFSLLTAVEDLFFWLVTAILSYALMFRQDNGRIRIFAVAAILFGMWFYHKTISRFVVKAVSGCLLFLLRGLRRICGRLLRILLRPIRFIMSKLLRRLRACRKRLLHAMKSIGESLKKRLNLCTESVKMKITALLPKRKREQEPEKTEPPRIVRGGLELLESVELTGAAENRSR